MGENYDRAKSDFLKSLPDNERTSNAVEAFDRSLRAAQARFQDSWEEFVNFRSWNSK